MGWHESHDILAKYIQ